MLMIKLMIIKILGLKNILRLKVMQEKPFCRILKGQSAKYLTSCLKNGIF